MSNHLSTEPIFLRDKVVRVTNKANKNVDPDTCYPNLHVNMLYTLLKAR